MTRASDLARLLGAGATINDGTTITTADNTPQLKLISTDADANAGPVLELKREWIVKCLNCGHDAHDGPLWRTELDYNGKEYEIEVCKHCRYDVDA